MASVDVGRPRIAGRKNRSRIFPGLRLWEMRYHGGKWEPITYAVVIHALGGRCDRHAARAIEAMVRGEIVSTGYAQIRIRPERARAAELERDRRRILGEEARP